MEINNNQEILNEIKKIRLEQLAAMKAQIAKCDLILENSNLRLKLISNEFNHTNERMDSMLKNRTASQNTINDKKTTIFLNPNNQQFKEIPLIDFSWKKKLCKPMLFLTGCFIGGAAMVAGVALKMADVLNQQNGLAFSIAGLCLVVLLCVGALVNYLAKINDKIEKNNDISNVILYNQTNNLGLNK